MGIICVSVSITLSWPRKWELPPALGCSWVDWGYGERRKHRITHLPASSCVGPHQTGLPSPVPPCSWWKPHALLIQKCAFRHRLHLRQQIVKERVFKRDTCAGAPTPAGGVSPQRSRDITATRDPECYSAWGHVFKGLCSSVGWSFLWWWKCPLTVLSSSMATSHVWLLNTQNCLETELLSLFNLVSLNLNLSSPMWPGAFGLDSSGIQNQARGRDLGPDTTPGRGRDSCPV